MTDKKTGTEKYGDFYWCVKSKLSEDGEIYLMADDARVLPDGTLNMIRYNKDKALPPSINLAIAPGNWIAVYAASLIDGAAVAVEQWKGEVKR